MDSTLVAASQHRQPASSLATLAARGWMSAGNTATPAQPTETEDDGFGFRDVLSMLNPLQYLPVVGSIYRAVTGDTIPEGVRAIGSLAVSAVMGGPMGMAISAATTALEKIVGIDSDQIARTVLASLGIISEDGGSQVAAAETPATPVSSVSANAQAVPWTRRQRRAYGVGASQAALQQWPGGSRRITIANTGAQGLHAANPAAWNDAVAAAYSQRTLNSLSPSARKAVMRLSA